EQDAEHDVVALLGERQAPSGFRGIPPRVGEFLGESRGGQHAGERSESEQANESGHVRQLRAGVQRKSTSVLPILGARIAYFSRRLSAGSRSPSGGPPTRGKVPSRPAG